MDNLTTSFSSFKTFKARDYLTSFFLKYQIYYSNLAMKLLPQGIRYVSSLTLNWNSTKNASHLYKSNLFPTYKTPSKPGESVKSTVPSRNYLLVTVGVSALYGFCTTSINIEYFFLHNLKTTLCFLTNSKLMITKFHWLVHPTVLSTTFMFLN